MNLMLGALLLLGGVGFTVSGLAIAQSADLGPTPESAPNITPEHSTETDPRIAMEPCPACGMG